MPTELARLHTYLGRGHWLVLSPSPSQAGPPLLVGTPSACPRSPPEAINDGSFAILAIDTSTDDRTDLFQLPVQELADGGTVIGKRTPQIPWHIKDVQIPVGVPDGEQLKDGDALSLSGGNRERERDRPVAWSC
jgi:hypothetical protein